MSAIAGQLSELVGILVNALVLGVSVGVLAVLTDWRK